MSKGDFEKLMSQAVEHHTHRYTATIITGINGQGEIYLRCEDTCFIGSSITFPLNPRKFYGEQIAREIEGLITEPHEVGESCSDCEFIRQAAAIARGEK